MAEHEEARQVAKGYTLDFLDNLQRLRSLVLNERIASGEEGEKTSDGDIICVYNQTQLNIAMNRKLPTWEKPIPESYKFIVICFGDEHKSAKATWAEKHIHAACVIGGNHHVETDDGVVFAMHNSYVHAGGCNDVIFLFDNASAECWNGGHIETHGTNRIKRSYTTSLDLRYGTPIFDEEDEEMVARMQETMRAINAARDKVRKAQQEFDEILRSTF